MPFQVDDDDPTEGQETIALLLPSPGRISERLLLDIDDHSFGDAKIYSHPPHFDVLLPPNKKEEHHVGHKWTMKTGESLKQRPWGICYNEYLMAYCEECKMHLSITVLQDGEDHPRCGTSESDKKRHHFHIESWTNSTRVSSSLATIEAKPEMGFFRCCQCPTEVHLQFWERIVPEYLLDNLKRRKSSSSASLNLINRPKETSPALADAFGTLSTYCTDALNRTGRNINTTPESPFGRRVGVDPDVIKFMEFLGWVSDGNELPQLLPPQWNEEEDEGRLRRKILEAAELELAHLALEAGRHAEKQEKPFNANITPAGSQIAQFLASKWPIGTKVDVFYPRGEEKKSDRSYVCLGVYSDADEDTIIKAYIKQVEDDPANAVFYLECLQDINVQLRSPKLNQILEEEISKGLFTRLDLDRAYKALEIDHPNEIDEEGIIAVFQIRCADSPERETEFENALRVIEHFRKLESTERSSDPKEKIFMDCAEAYKRLRINDHDISDDMVISSYISCVADYPHERDLLAEAIAVLGKERKSVVIRSFLSEQNESQVAVGPMNQMTLEEAFIVLGLVEEGARGDDNVMVAFNEMIALQPQRADELKRAVDVIAEDRDSIPLKTFLIDMNTTPDKQKAGPGSETHPVGLENIAQTCYMNSLFQYYFSVRPLRNAILQFEEHEEGDLSEEDLRKKQISKWELQRSKRFVAQLRILFQELITSHLAYIRPKEELVRLTLVDAKQEIEDAAEKRRRSLNTNKSQPTMDKNVPDLIEIEDTTVQDPPPGSPIIKPILDDDVPLMTSPVENSSESQPNVSDDHDYEFVEHETNEWPTFEPMSIDKENVPPLQQPVPRHSTSSKIPLQEILPDNVESTAMVEVEEKGDQEDAEMLDLPALITPPQSPPPIPQRPMRRRSTWGALKYGSQQDVTECITNCLSQLHAAFKAEELGPGGDQIDLFKRLFYIRVRHVLRDLKAGPNAKPVDEREELYGSMVPIYVDAEGGSLYDAMDLALGREKVEYQGVEDCEKTTTITYLPPILQIQIVRAQFNRDVGAGYKENAHLELEPKIYMDRYVETLDDDLSARRDDYWKWKVELAAVQMKKAELLRKNTDMPLNPLELLSMSRTFLEKFSVSGSEEHVPTELLDGLELYEKHLRKQIDKLDKDIGTLKSRIKQQFTDRRTFGYRLHSVFIHRGDVAHGHYWIYIYDFPKDRWFKYNDEQVSEVDEKVVFADTSAEGAGPYFITYVKEDAANDLVEVIKRDLSGNLMSFVD